MAGRFTRWNGNDRRRDALRRFWVRGAMQELAADARHDGPTDDAEAHGASEGEVSSAEEPHGS